MRSALPLLCLVVAAGCAGPAITFEPSETEASPTPIASPEATATSLPTPMPTPAVIGFDDLPPLAADRTTITGLCDPPPGSTDPDAPYRQPLLFCGDGLELGLRAVATVSDAPIARAYLQFSDCPAGPCTQDQLERAVFTGWTATAAWSIEIDAAGRTLSLPRLDASATWPTMSGDPPAVDRPPLDEAPPEVADRTALPFCGTIEFDMPMEAESCFLAAVLGQRPAELIETIHGTEGGSAPVVMRFVGSGSLLAYSRGIDALGNVGGWYKQWNYIQLGVESWRWGRYQWSDGIDVP